jgi:hypothetical protein
VILQGYGPAVSSLRTTAAIGLLDYSPASLQEARMTIRDMMLFGDKTDSTLLVNIANGAGIFLENLLIRGSITDCVKTDATYFVNLTNVRLDDCDQYGVNLSNGSNVFTLQNVDFEASSVGSTAALRVHLSVTGTVTGCAFEGNNLTLQDILLDSSSDININGNFLELSTGSAIVCVDTAGGICSGITIANNNISSAGTQIIDFSANNPAHRDITITNNRFAAVSGTHVLFDPGSGTLTYTACQNFPDATPANYVQGINAANKCVIKGEAVYDTSGDLARDDNAGTLRYNGSIHIGADGDVSITRSTQDFQINSGNAAGTITLRTVGSDRLSVSAAGVVTVKGSSSDLLFIPESTGVTIRGAELSGDPSAPAANGFILYAKDNGSGKTTLCARFASGATQCFATEP